MRNVLLEQLSRIQHIPSVPFQERPPDTEFHDEEEEDMEKRSKCRIWDGEYFGSESEEDGKPPRCDADTYVRSVLKHENKRLVPVSNVEPLKRIKQEEDGEAV
uniref:Uncharacterized protein n=1 Tax=Picea sitchensis TaxID=3332 RepID=B8LP03_PICSI|nr:unknown [Picea sitchensis]